METDRPTEAELRQAHADAVQAALTADQLEERARQARRAATVKMQHYEDMLLVAQGQMTLPFEH